jgi:broad specificity phosphatase PhoE
MEIIIRHGLTVANKNQITSGHTDTPLTKEGRLQARKLAERLENLDIEQIYSSPLSRAIDTAQPLAGKIKVKVNLDPRLMEVNFGSFEADLIRKFQKRSGWMLAVCLMNINTTFVLMAASHLKRLRLGLNRS